jgi:predicted nuclease of predicted toxin-antitoxin system
VNVAAFLADECVSALVVQELRDVGVDVVYAQDVCAGEPDERVLQLATESGRILITDDLGFGELAIRQSYPAAGVIILSLYSLPEGVRAKHAVKGILDVREAIAGHLAVIEPGRVRMRPLPAQQA